MQTVTRRLTQKQAELFGYIVHFYRKNGFPPSITQMIEATESQKSIVSRRIHALIERGCIAKENNYRRNIMMLAGNGVDDLVSKISLLPERKKILSAIKCLTKERGNPPSVYAISKKTEIATLRVRRHLNFLEHKGLTLYDKDKCAVYLL